MIGFAWLNPTFAQTSPLKVLQQELTGKEEKPIAIPDPLQLEVNWWNYFSTTNAPLTEQKINDFIQKTQPQVASLEGDLKVNAEATLKQIALNLKNLLSVINKPNPEPLAKPISLETYTLQQIMDLLHSGREKTEHLRQLEAETANEEALLKKDKHNLDTLLAAYLEMRITNPEKYTQGLNIIANRTQQALREQLLKEQKKQNEFQKSYLFELDKIKGIAINRLAVTQEEFDLLTKSVDKAKATYSNASKVLQKLQLEPKALEIKNNASNDLRSQQIFKTEINESLAAIDLLIEESKRDLTDLLLNKDEVNYEGIKNELLARNQLLNNINLRIVTWTEKNNINRRKLTENNDEFLQTRTQANLKDHLLLIQEIELSLQKLANNVLDAQFILGILNDTYLLQQSTWGQIQVQSTQYWNNTYQYIRDKLHTALFKVGDTPVTALGFARLLLIIAVAWWVAYWLNRFLLRIGKRGEGAKLPAYYLIGRVTYYSLILAGFLIGLTAIGIDFTNFALVAGALAIGLGFGLQSILSNFVSGLILLFEHSIKVGDFIELGDGSLRGEVREINVRSTIIRNNDGVDIIIPNSEFMNTKMLNWTLSEPIRRMRYPFKVAFGVDKEQMRAAVLAAIEPIPHTQKGIPGRAPSVWLVGFGEFAYEFELVVWLTPRAVKRPHSVHAAYYWAIDNALRENNFTIPVPRRELYFKNSPVPMPEDFEKELEAFNGSMDEADDSYTPKQQKKSKP